MNQPRRRRTSPRRQTSPPAAAYQAALTYRVEPLDEPHDLSGFRCGNTDLDSWLHDHAGTATGHGTRTWVVLDEVDRVIGFFAIAPHTIDRGALAKKTGRGAPQQIPAILLAKLALAEDLHGQRLGSELLVVALETILDVRIAPGASSS